MRPIADRVLLVLLPSDSDQIFLPDGSTAAPQRGIVRAVGRDVVEVEEGSVVLFNQSKTLRIRAMFEDGAEPETLFLLHEAQILAVVEEALDHAQDTPK